MQTARRRFRRGDSYVNPSTLLEVFVFNRIELFAKFQSYERKVSGKLVALNIFGNQPDLLAKVLDSVSLFHCSVFFHGLTIPHRAVRVKRNLCAVMDFFRGRMRFCA